MTSLLCKTNLNPELIRLVFNVVFHVIEGMNKSNVEAAQKSRKRKGRT